MLKIHVAGPVLLEDYHLVEKLAQVGTALLLSALNSAHFVAIAYLIYFFCSAVQPRQDTRTSGACTWNVCQGILRGES